jgi:hypothetical protein
LLQLCCIPVFYDNKKEEEKKKKKKKNKKKKKQFAKWIEINTQTSTPAGFY